MAAEAHRACPCPTLNPPRAQVGSVSFSRFPLFWCGLLDGGRGCFLFLHGHLSGPAVPKPCRVARPPRVGELSFIRLFVVIGPGVAMVDPSNSGASRRDWGGAFLPATSEPVREDPVRAQRARRAYP